MLIISENCYIYFKYRGVAQPGSVHPWGGCGRWFKSSRPDFERSSFMRLSLIIVLFLFTLNNLFAEVESIGKIKSLKGTVSIIRNGSSITAKLGTKLQVKDEIVTSRNSDCSILFKDNTMISLDENTTYIIVAYNYNPKKSNYELKGEVKTGKILFNSGKIPKIASNNVNIKTPSAIIGVKGTKFVMEVNK